MVVESQARGLEKLQVPARLSVTEGGRPEPPDPVAPAADRWRASGLHHQGGPDRICAGRAGWTGTRTAP